MPRASNKSVDQRPLIHHDVRFDPTCRPGLVWTGTRGVPRRPTMKQSMALSELFLWGVRGRAQFPMTPKLFGRNTRKYEWAGRWVPSLPVSCRPTFCDWTLQRETGQIPRCLQQWAVSGMVGRGRCTVICREAWAGRLWANPLASAVMYRLPSMFGRSR